MNPLLFLLIIAFVVCPACAATANLVRKRQRTRLIGKRGYTAVDGVDPIRGSWNAIGTLELNNGGSHGHNGGSHGHGGVHGGGVHGGGVHGGAGHIGGGHIGGGGPVVGGHHG